jgi:hypothetical protein
MEFGGAARVLRGHSVSEEHQKSRRAIEAIGREGKETGQNKEKTASQELKSQETTENDEYNLLTESEGESTTIALAAPAKRTARQTRLASKTPSRQIFMVENPKKKITKELDLVSIIKELQTQIKDLTTVVIEQRTQFKTQLETQATEIKKLSEAISARHESNLPGSTRAHQHVGPSTGWPSLPTSQQQNQDPTSRGRHAQGLGDRERVVVVTTGKSAAEVQGKSVKILKETAEKELRQEEATKDIQVIGVSAASKGRFEITVASKEQAEKARSNARWVRGFGAEAKVKEATWYPIKVDGVAREVICTAKGEGYSWEFRDDVLDIINKSNSREGFKVKALKIHWLSKQSENASGSIAVYLDSWATAQQLLAERTFLLGDNAASTTPFIRQEQPYRCYNCNQYGHYQAKCLANPKCGSCAAQHQTRNCPGTNPDKCAACHGAHKATDPRCSLYQKELKRIAEGRKQKGNTRPLW